MTVTGTEWIVILAGLSAIAWVNWYFFVAGRTAVSATSGGSRPAEITITVDGGYAPSTVRVKARQPVRLIFDRRDTGSCSDEVVFPDFGLRKFLPTGKQTTVEITPPAAGSFSFMCGMSMLRGTIVAED